MLCWAPWSNSRQWRCLAAAAYSLLLMLAVDACLHHRSNPAAAAVVAGAQAVEPDWVQYEDYSGVDFLRTERLLLATGQANTSAAAAAAANSTVVNPAQQQQHRSGPRCGVRSLTALEHSSLTFKLQKARLSAARLAKPVNAPGTMSIASVQQQQQQDRSLTVNVYFHVISGTKDESTVDAPPDLLAQQLAVMNSAYGPWNIMFVLKGVTRVQSDTWAVTEINTDAETAMKTRLRRGVGSDLNIYLIRPNSGTLGWSTFPWEMTKLGQAFDGVVVHVGTLPGGTMAPYNKGYTLVHEVGHWLGLLHVFENGCNAPGDSVDDTPPQASAAYGCPLDRDTCSGSGKDPVTNYMGYTDDACMTGFTRGQADRILDMWGVFRGVQDGTVTLESGLPTGVVEQPVQQQTQPQPQQQPQQQWQQYTAAPQQQPAPRASPRSGGILGLGKLLPALFRRNTGQHSDNAPAASTTVGVADITEDAASLYGSVVPQDPAAVFAQQQAAVAAAAGQQAGSTTHPQYTQQLQYANGAAPQQQQQGAVQGYYTSQGPGVPVVNSAAYAPSFTTTYRPYVAAEASLPAIYGTTSPTGVAAAHQAVQTAASQVGQQQQQQQQQQQPTGNALQLNSYSAQPGSYKVLSPPPAASMYIQARPARGSSNNDQWQATLLAAMGSQ